MKPSPSPSFAASERPQCEVMVRVHAKHHFLVRWGHWTTIPVLLGLIISGISIYWSSPIFQHSTDATGNFDRAADLGIWLCAHVPGMHGYSSPPDWVYNHLSLGPGMLNVALRLHWFCAYLFMLNGALYLLGLALGDGWRSLVPRRDHLRASLKMAWFYTVAPFASVFRRPWPHPTHTGKYNALQKTAYASVSIAGVLATLSGWAIHKPAQLHWLAAAFGGYNAARVWHFCLMCFFILFVVPHIALVLLDGWDTMRSMITGWSFKAERHDDIQ